METEKLTPLQRKQQRRQLEGCTLPTTSMKSNASETSDTTTTVSSSSSKDLPQNKENDISQTPKKPPIRRYIPPSTMILTTSPTTSPGPARNQPPPSNNAPVSGPTTVPLRKPSAPNPSVNSNRPLPVVKGLPKTPDNPIRPTLKKQSSTPVVEIPPPKPAPLKINNNNKPRQLQAYRAVSRDEEEMIFEKVSYSSSSEEEEEEEEDSLEEISPTEKKKKKNISKTVEVESSIKGILKTAKHFKARTIVSSIKVSFNVPYNEKEELKPNLSRIKFNTAPGTAVYSSETISYDDNDDDVDDIENEDEEQEEQKEQKEQKDLAKKTSTVIREDSPLGITKYNRTLPRPASKKPALSMITEIPPSNTNNFSAKNKAPSKPKNNNGEEDDEDEDDEENKLLQQLLKRQSGKDQGMKGTISGNLLKKREGASSIF